MAAFWAWHMKLRTKSAELHIYLIDPRRRRLGSQPCGRSLAPQLEEMRTRPDIVLQYAHFLADKYSVPGRPRPIVQVELYVSPNGPPFLALIDPTIDLASVNPSLRPADWILPLEAHLHAGLSDPTD